MATDSSTGGYLAPTTPPPAQGLELDLLIQGVIVGVTGLPGTMVRPRVQPNDPQTGQPIARTPNVDEDWCAVGVTGDAETQMPAQTHISDGVGSTLMQRYDLLEVTASFYGPHADGYARLCRDMLYVSQNREAMRAEGLEFYGVLSLINVPDIPNVGTRRRSDLKLRFYQTVERTIPILNLLEAQGTVRTDGGSVSAAGEYDAPFDTKD